MKVPRELLVALFNMELRKGRTLFEVREYWRDDRPLFSGRFDGDHVSLDVIGYRDYCSMFPRDNDIPSYQELIQKVLHASCIIEEDQISPFRDRFREMMTDEEPYRRNIRFYYDTNSLMNNYFHIFRELIPDFTRKANHNTSLGVVSELEDLQDRRSKGNHFQDHFRKLYGDDHEIFFNQPNLTGRYARLAYSEIGYLRDDLRVNLLTDDGVGDRKILSAFVHDSQDNNLEGIMVTNDATMAERASMRMGSWHVRFDLSSRLPERTGMDHFIEAVYRAAVIYGRVRIGDDIIIGGVYRGKGVDDWNGRIVDIDSAHDREIERTRRILKDIPEELLGTGYYS